jgi:hypothetical protein
VVESEAPAHLGPEVEGEELGKADFVDEEDDQEQGENTGKKLEDPYLDLYVNLEKKSPLNFLKGRK